MSRGPYFSRALFVVGSTVVAVLVGFGLWTTRVAAADGHRNHLGQVRILNATPQAVLATGRILPSARVAAVRANASPFYLATPLLKRVTNQFLSVTETWERHSYLLTEPMTWMEAEALAQELGGHLVTLDSWEEELWIKETFGENELFWIGLNDISEEGNWVWSSGEPVTYTNWASVEPNDCGGFGPGCAPEDAAAMNWCAEGGNPCLGDRWNDLSIDAHLKAVVELQRITICHQPGRQAERTLGIPIQALDGHLRHGDTIGPCQ